MKRTCNFCVGVELVPCVREHEHGVKEILPFLRCTNCGVVYWNKEKFDEQSKIGL